jgi:2-methylisocitrate lyase-like PEP mutase family enzyme
MKIVFECYDLLSAHQLINCGYANFWLSGLTNSVHRGFPDNGSLGYQMLADLCGDIKDRFDEATVFLDGDDGYGDVAGLVDYCERRHMDAIALEDKSGPKVNSFSDQCQTQIDVNGYIDKIKCFKDTAQTVKLISRCESLILGQTPAQAAERVNTYIECGADMVFVHAKDSDEAKVVEVLEQIDRSVEVVICPTTYRPIKSRNMVDYLIMANQLTRVQHKATLQFLEEIENDPLVAWNPDVVCDVKDLLEVWPS